MNIEQIENVINNMPTGYESRKEITDNNINIKYDSCSFDMFLNDSQLEVNACIILDYRSCFNQESVNYLNSITSSWQIYKNELDFKFNPKDEKELESILTHLLLV